MRLLKLCFVMMLLCLIWDAESVYASEEEYQEVSVGNTSTFTVLIPKEIKMVGSSGVASYSVGVRGTISDDYKVVIQPTESMVMTCATKPDITVSVSQEKTEWVKADIESEECRFTKGMLIADSVFSGRYSGSIVFSISVESVYQDGAYDKDGNLICMWETLGLDIERDYAEGEVGLVEGHPLYALRERYPEVTMLKVPESITRIGNYAFASCTGLENIQLPNSLEYIGVASFEKCSNLRTLVLPDGVSVICSNAFAECSSLESLIIPAATKEIGDKVVYACYSLDELKVIEGNEVYTSRDNNGLECNSLIHVGGQTLIAGIAKTIVPRSVTTIGECAFANQTSLTSITLPESVIVLSDRAFEGSGLTEVRMSNSLVRIGNSVFAGCNNLEVIILPESVYNIGDSVFNGCSTLKSAKLSVTLQGITENMFKDCSSLREVIIPDDVASIAVGAFENCTSLENITLPEKLRTIGTVFRGCASLREVVYKGVAYTNELDLKSALEAAGLVVDCSIWDK